MKLIEFLKTISIKNRIIYLFNYSIQILFDKLFFLAEFKKLSDLRFFYYQLVVNGFKYIHTPTTLIVKNSNYEINLRFGTSDLLVFEQIFINKEYKTILNYLLLNNISFDVMIDAGSNIGLTTLYYNQYFPKAKYICIEPDTKNFEQLKINLKKINNVFCLNNALWHNNEQLVIENNFRDKLDWSKSVKIPSNVDYDCNAKNLTSGVTIDEIIRKFKLAKIDFLKIDIEGSEKFLLEENCDLNFLLYVKIIAIEVHEEVVNKSYIIQVLKSYNFLLFDVGELLVGIK